MSKNIPCQNPGLCRVKSHLPGTQADCMKTKTTKSAGGTSSLNIAANPASKEVDNTPDLVFDDDGYAEVEIQHDDSNVIEVLEAYYVDGPNPHLAITASTSIDFHNQLPDSWSFKQKEEFLNENSNKIETFLSERYPSFGQLVGDDWSSIRADFEATIEGSSGTEGEAFRVAYEDTDIVQLYNEIDRGTFGTENFDRLLADSLGIEDDDRHERPELSEVANRLIPLGVEPRRDYTLGTNHTTGMSFIEYPMPPTPASGREYDAWLKQQKLNINWKPESVDFEWPNYKAEQEALANGADRGGVRFDENNNPRIVGQFENTNKMTSYLRKSFDV